MTHKAEKLALGLILTNLRALGWEHHELDDGGGWQMLVNLSIEQVVEECAAVDMCSLRLVKDGDKTNVVFIVWGNNPSELIADHTCSYDFEDAVDGALKAIWAEWPCVETAQETEEWLSKPFDTPRPPATNSQYAATGGNRCPYCNSADIGSEDTVQTEAGIAWQDVSCNSCGGRWQDEYTLTGYSRVEPQ